MASLQFVPAATHKSNVSLMRLPKGTGVQSHNDIKSLHDDNEKLEIASLDSKRDLNAKNSKERALLSSQSR